MATIVVTGAAGALGQAVVDSLVARGDRVAAIDTERASARLTALAARHDRVLAIEADVSSGAEWVRVLSRIEAELGPVEGAALVAGAWAGGAPLHEETDDVAWRAMMDTNVETARVSLRALLAKMVPSSRGSVVVIGSRVVERPWTSAGATAYAASKAAVVALAQAAAAEVLTHGVRINAVLPSIIDTPANRRSMPDAEFSRWVSAESLAAVIAFLLSDAARDVSGAAIPVYGRA